MIRMNLKRGPSTWLRTGLFSLLLVLFLSQTVTGAESVKYQIPRIDDASIEAKIPGIEKMLKRNNLLRKAVIGIGATAAVGGYILYKWWATKEPISDLQVQLDKAIPGADSTPVTFDTLRAALKPLTDKSAAIEKALGALQQKLQGAQWTGWFRFAKAAFLFGLQTVATSIIWNQIIISQRYCRTVFKDRDLKWYLAMQSHLGTFICFEDMEGNPHERFNEAKLLLELDGIAQLFDEEVSGDAQKTDELAQMLRSASSALIDEITGVIAFMQHTVSNVLTLAVDKDDESMKKELSEASSYVHYLCAHTNTFAQSIENIIQNKLGSPTQKGGAYNTIRKFITDFKAMVSGFNRVQQEVEATV